MDRSGPFRSQIWFWNFLITHTARPLVLHGSSEQKAAYFRKFPYSAFAAAQDA